MVTSVQNGYRFILVAVLGIFTLLFPVPAFSEEELVAEIDVPYPDSLVRGDVPVFGRAFGKGFTGFILDYGKGKNPGSWEVIYKSKEAQKGYSRATMGSITSFGKTIDGNLGTWQTGLDEYIYADYPVNLSGIYTLRLRVFGKDGLAEDKETVEVGRVVLNSSGGKVRSEDDKAQLLIKEHSLVNPILVMSLKSVDSSKVDLPENLSLASKIYEVRPPGKKFIKDLTLYIQSHPNLNADRLAIFVYDTLNGTWSPLKTEKDKKGFMSTKITTLPPKYAIYGVFQTDTGSLAFKNESKSRAVGCPKSDLLFTASKFDHNYERWPSYTNIGAESYIVEENNRRFLKIVNSHSPGPFSSLIIEGPIDMRKYQWFYFDYKIPENLKINLMVKIGGKWFDVKITDDDKVYWDVNMELVGAIPNIKADNKWHSCCVNLYKLLEKSTGNFVAEKIIMADWDINGFKELNFGEGKQGASYCIDNFTVLASSEKLIEKAWEDFNAKRFGVARQHAKALIEHYSGIANLQAAGLKGFPKEQGVETYGVMEHVAIAHFICAEILRDEGKTEEAEKIYRLIEQSFPFAKCADPRGWEWKIAEVASDRITTIKTGYDFEKYTSEFLTNKAWSCFEAKDYLGAELYANKCISLYEPKANEQQRSLNNFAPNKFIPFYWALNNVGTCCFILGEIYNDKSNRSEAGIMYRKVVEKFFFARCWDPRGWYWKVVDHARSRLRENLKDEKK